ncbi:acetyl-CoA carboxylase biotin carboxyl carrier protein [Pseudoruegeria sp. SK021]|uniref:acetyl-CoA carboxylase biotin carboxyl carrier protein n=1 Tax=Pseudoruegeria sp. SK021 TaxID=1933035 RepID=UPI000A25ACFC|nr:acetyl-CoA carboxylase biotin carboxyl carrier protein [Pseudoruegeria sp. SK021]OSP54957.1 acetyl-CoA carboxylase, biotin carboxyl carrier protein [Pseudoruegeria sp. SK021]
MSNKSHSDDVAFIRALAELLRENDLTELHVKREFGEEGALNVRVSRGGVAASVAPAHSAPAQITFAPPAASAPSADPAAHPGAVTSPMVGTVYLQPEPDSTPFIAVGATVTEGQTLLIIEAMKTMNQIPSPKAGRIARILVEDGSPVEFGAPLVIIE